MAPKSYSIMHTEASKGWGGQEIRVLTEMEAMRRRGHRLLLAAPPSSQIFQQAKEEGFNPNPMNTHRWMYPLTILKLARWLRQERVEVINPHSSADGWLAGLAGRLARAPLIIRSRHIEVDYPNRRTSRLAYGTLPHHVITTSDRISRRLINDLKLDPDRVQCIPTGIDLDMFDARIEGSLHKELQLPMNTPLVGMVSVIRSWKGHDFFVEAAQLVAKKCPTAHYVIAGGGNESRLEKIRRWTIEAGLDSRFHLLGHRMDVPNLLASYSVLVLPSTNHEGIPQIVLQSHAMTCPVVGTTVGGIPEVVSDGQTGLLVPSKDPFALAQAIGALLDDPNFCARLTRQARVQVEAHHTLEAMCDRLEELYRRHLPR